MHCTLFIPELFWPAHQAEEAVRGLELPALTMLLARARSSRHPAVAPEAWLCQAFEVERQQDWPVAPLTLELDTQQSAQTYWLRADPVHLVLQRDHLGLMDSRLFDLTAETAHAYIELLNGHFSSDGLAFFAGTPTRWYVRCPEPPALATTTLLSAAGQDVADHMPQGSSASVWRQVFNEIQMLLHEHPLNEAREGAGQPAINSVWFWGGGTRPPVPGRAFDTVCSDDALATALGVRASATTYALPGDARSALAQAGSGRRLLAVLPQAATGVSYSDLPRWHEALQQLERDWFAPLLGALRGRHISGLTIVAAGRESCWRFELTPGELLKFWRPRRPLSTYA